MLQVRGMRFSSDRITAEATWMFLFYSCTGYLDGFALARATWMINATFFLIASYLHFFAGGKPDDITIVLATVVL